MEKWIYVLFFSLHNIYIYLGYAEWFGILFNCSEGHSLIALYIYSEYGCVDFNVKVKHVI